jgi:hypothetical protein
MDAMSLLPAEILLSLATLGYSLIPALFDLNATHATNPLWVGHARFHVVWQVVSYIGFGLIGLGLIWAPGAAHGARLWLAAALGGAAYGGFFAAVLGRHIYGGATYDPNGVLPVRPPLIGRYYAFEVNITLFTVTTAVLVAGAVSLARATLG